MTRTRRFRLCATFVLGAFYTQLLLSTVLPGSAEARVNPLGHLIRQVQKANMLVVFDTSGSMNGVPGGQFSYETEVGVDCDNGQDCRKGVGGTCNYVTDNGRPRICTADADCRIGKCSADGTPCNQDTECVATSGGCAFDTNNNPNPGIACTADSDCPIRRGICANSMGTVSCDLDWDGGAIAPGECPAPNRGTCEKAPVAGVACDIGGTPCQEADPGACRVTGAACTNDAMCTVGKCSAGAMPDCSSMTPCPSVGTCQNTGGPCNMDSDCPQVGSDGGVADAGPEAGSDAPPNTVGCNDDSVGCGNGKQSASFFSVDSTKTYYLFVDTGATTASGAYMLRINPPVVPLNGNTTCTSAPSIDPGGGRYSASLGTSEVYYKWVPARSGTAALTLSGFTGSGGFEFHGPNTCTAGGGSGVAGAPRSWSPGTVTGGSTYYIYVIRDANTVFQLDVLLLPSTISGTGTCGAPVALDRNGGTFNSTSASAGSVETGTCGGGGVGKKESVFSWMPKYTGTYSIDTCGNSTTDTVVYLRGSAGCSIPIGAAGEEIANTSPPSPSSDPGVQAAPGDGVCTYGGAACNPSLPCPKACSTSRSATCTADSECNTCSNNSAAFCSSDNQCNRCSNDSTRACPGGVATECATGTCSITGAGCFTSADCYRCSNVAAGCTTDASCNRCSNDTTKACTPAGVGIDCGLGTCSNNPALTCSGAAQCYRCSNLASATCSLDTQCNTCSNDPTKICATAADCGPAARKCLNNDSITCTADSDCARCSDDASQVCASGADCKGKCSNNPAIACTASTVVADCGVDQKCSNDPTYACTAGSDCDRCSDNGGVRPCSMPGGCQTCSTDRTKYCANNSFAECPLGTCSNKPAKTCASGAAATDCAVCSNNPGQLKSCGTAAADCKTCSSDTTKYCATAADCNSTCSNNSSKACTTATLATDCRTCSNDPGNSRLCSSSASDCKTCNNAPSTFCNDASGCPGNSICSNNGVTCTSAAADCNICTNNPAQKKVCNGDDNQCKACSNALGTFCSTANDCPTSGACSNGGLACNENSDCGGSCTNVGADHPRGTYTGYATASYTPSYAGAAACTLANAPTTCGRCSNNSLKDCTGANITTNCGGGSTTGTCSNAPGRGCVVKEDCYRCTNDSSRACFFDSDCKAPGKCTGDNRCTNDATRLCTADADCVSPGVCGKVTQLGCADQGCASGNGSKFSVSVLGGAEHWLFMDRANMAAAGQYTLKVTPPARPLDGGASCAASAPDIDREGGVYAGSSSTFDVWYEWNPLRSGQATVELSGFTGNAQIFLHPSTCTGGPGSGSGASPRTIGPTMATSVTAGTTYYILVDRSSDTPYTLSVSLPTVDWTAAAAQPTGTCASTPARIDGNGGSYLSDYDGAGASGRVADSGTCGTAQVGSMVNDVIFLFRPTYTGVYTFETCGSPTDTLMYLRAGRCTPSSAGITCTAGGSGSGQTIACNGSDSTPSVIPTYCSGATCNSAPSCSLPAGASCMSGATCNAPACSTPGGTTCSTPGAATCAAPTCSTPGGTTCSAGAASCGNAACGVAPGVTCAGGNTCGNPTCDYGRSCSAAAANPGATCTSDGGCSVRTRGTCAKDGTTPCGSDADCVNTCAVAADCPQGKCQYDRSVSCTVAGDCAIKMCSDVSNNPSPYHAQCTTDAQCSASSATYTLCRAVAASPCLAAGNTCTSGACTDARSNACIAAAPKCNANPSADATCSTGATCGPAPTCSGMGTCSDTATCGGVPVCDTSGLCSNTATCTGGPTCLTGATCGTTATCDNNPCTYPTNRCISGGNTCSYTGACVKTNPCVTATTNPCGSRPANRCNAGTPGNKCDYPKSPNNDTCNLSGMGSIPLRMCRASQLTCNTTADCPTSGDECIEATSRTIMAKRALKSVISKNFDLINFGFMTFWQGNSSHPDGPVPANEATNKGYFPYYSVPGGMLPSQTITTYFSQSQLEAARVVSGGAPCFTEAAGPTATCTISGIVYDRRTAMTGGANSRYRTHLGGGTYAYTDVDWCAATGIYCNLAAGTGRYEGSYYTYSTALRVCSLTGRPCNNAADCKKKDPDIDEGTCAGGGAGGVQRKIRAGYTGKKITVGATDYTYYSARNDYYNKGDKPPIAWPTCEQDDACSKSCGGRWDTELSSFIDTSDSVGPTFDNKAISETNVLKITQRLDKASLGGLVTYHGTPIGCTLMNDGAGAAARNYSAYHYMKDVKAGDSLACRKNFVLLITDGATNGPGDVNSNGATICDTAACADADPVGKGCKCKSVLAAYKMRKDVVSGQALGIQTFVIGFSGDVAAGPPRVINDNIAKAGGTGQALLAKNEGELTAAIQKAVFEALKGSYVTSPASSSSGTQQATTVDAGNLAIDTRVDFPAWQGHLLVYDLSTGSPNPPLKWDGAKALEFNPATGCNAAGKCWWQRNVWTSVWNPSLSPPGYDMVKILVDSSTKAITNKAQLYGLGLGASADEAERIAKWMLGDPAMKNPAVLGAIINSTAIDVGQPGRSPLPGGTEFFNARQTRANILYVGASDGMLHAFRTNGANAGEELFAYIPPDMLPVQTKVFAQGGQLADPRDHIFGLANSPKVKNICTANCDVASNAVWKTVLMMPEGYGGNASFMLDITDPFDGGGAIKTAIAPVGVLWHTGSAQFSSSPYTTYLGQTISVPAFFFVWDGINLDDYRVVFGSGYPVLGGPATQGLSFVTASAKTGQRFDATSLPSSLNNCGSISGLDRTLLSDVATARHNVQAEKNKLLAAYAGDTWGNLWRYETRPSLGTPTIQPVGDASTFGCGHPLHFAPGIVQLDRDDQNANVGLIYLVQVTNSHLDPVTAPYSATFPASKIVIRKDKLNTGTGDVDTDGTFNADTGQIVLTVGVDSEICAVKAFGSPTCTTSMPLSARPTGTPLAILKSDASGFLIFTLWFVPPVAGCGAGNTYLTLHEINTNGAAGFVQKMGMSLAPESLSGIVVSGGKIYVLGTSGAMEVTGSVGQAFGQGRAVRPGGATGDRFRMTGWTEIP